jgi:hypothetical protein
LVRDAELAVHSPPAQSVRCGYFGLGFPMFIAHLYRGPGAISKIHPVWRLQAVAAADKIEVGIPEGHVFESLWKIVQAVPLELHIAEETVQDELQDNGSFEQIGLQWVAVAS